jgi:hypothetical protein
VPACCAISQADHRDCFCLLILRRVPWLPSVNACLYRRIFPSGGFDRVTVHNLLERLEAAVQVDVPPVSAATAIELSHSRAPPPGQVGTPRICRPPLNSPRASSQNDKQRMEGVRALAQRQAVQLERLVALAQVHAPHFRSRATAMHSIGDSRAVSPLVFIDASMSWARPPLDADT